MKFLRSSWNKIKKWVKEVAFVAIKEAARTIVHLLVENIWAAV